MRAHARARGLFFLKVEVQFLFVNTCPIDLSPHAHTYSSYIAAGYVKWIEAAGGRAVPIRCVR